MASNFPSNPNPELRAADLARRFGQRFGRQPAGVWAAPGRANLIGEHTDYNDGFVLPLALGQCAYAAVSPRGDGRLNLVSEQCGAVELGPEQLVPGTLEGWATYVAGAVWAVREHAASLTTGQRDQAAPAFDRMGFDLLLDSDVPNGAGLSSSAAVECVTALAVADLLGAQLTRRELALCAHRAEVEMAGVPCGTMDQMISVCGEPDHALFIDCRTLDTRPVPLPLERLDLGLLIVDTRAPHRLASGEYAARRRDCEAAARALGVRALRDASLDAVETLSSLSPVERRRARHVVTENARVLALVSALERGEWSAAGPLISASHASLRDDFEVTVPELDIAVEAAHAAGALGARMIGGGFGGSVLCLVPRKDAPAIFEAVESAFREQRFRSPAALLGQPSAGARRLS